jgi:hypothetical protein
VEIPPIVISRAKNLERLTLRFLQSAFESPSEDDDDDDDSEGEPSLSAVLEKLSFPFFEIGSGDQGTLTKLSTIVIEMHDVPAQCLSEEAIAKDKDMWDRLDRGLSREAGYVPNVERLEMKLFLRRGERMMDGEIQQATSHLLPSLAPSVRSIMISPHIVVTSNMR